MQIGSSVVSSEKGEELDLMYKKLSKNSMHAKRYKINPLWIHPYNQVLKRLGVLSFCYHIMFCCSKHKRLGWDFQTFETFEITWLRPFCKTFKAYMITQSAYTKCKIHAE